MTTSSDKDQRPVDDLADWVAGYREAKAHAKRWTEIADRAKGHLVTALGDAEIGTIDGRPAVRNTTVSGTRIDLDKLRAEFPEAAESCTVPHITRRFTITGEVL